MIAPKTFLSATAYYDKYFNKMNQYDDNTYLIQNRGSSFSSVYDDYSVGGIVNITTTALRNNVITFSANNKFDSHTEYNDEIAANEATGQNFKAGERHQNYRDNTFYLGLEDVVTITPFMKAVAGVSFNSRKNSKAQEYGTHYETGVKNVLYDFPTGGDHAFDFKTGLIVESVEHHVITFSVSRRSRFASQKERYSSKFGGQVPNPDLKSEYTISYDLTYSGRIVEVFQYEVSGFVNPIRNAIFGRKIGEQDNGDPILFNVNLGKAIFQGFEVAFGYKPIKNVTLGANYSFIEMKDKTKDNDEKFVDVPKHKSVVSGTYDVPVIRSAFHANLEWYGKRYITSDGETAPTFTLVNAKWSIYAGKGLNVDFGVRNLLDRNYFLSKGHPKEGRSFITGLRYTY